MQLRRIIRESLHEYFVASEHWNNAMRVMQRDAKHAHIYCDTIIHPESLREVVRAYFEAQNIKLKRKIQVISQGKGIGNVYYADPEGMCHFEVFCRHNPDIVLEPTPGAAARGGKSFESWDDDFMCQFYSRYDFRKPDAAEKEEIHAYFESQSWKQGYVTMAYSSGRNLHSHCLIKTSIHPEEILKVGARAIEAKGWTLDRAVSLVFGMSGYEQGKITYLLKKPEIVLELEWEFDDSVVIEPGPVPIARIISDQMVQNDLAGIDWIRLESTDIEWLKRNFEQAQPMKMLSAA